MILNKDAEQEVEIKNRIEGAARTSHKKKIIFVDRKKLSRKINMSVYWSEMKKRL